MTTYKKWYKLSIKIKRISNPIYDQKQKRESKEEKKKVVVPRYDSRKFLHVWYAPLIFFVIVKVHHKFFTANLAKKR